MQPATIDLTVYKGSTFSKTIQWKTGDPVTPVNLTGCTLRMQIRKAISDNTVMDSLTSENGKLIFVNASQGLLKINIPASTSTAYTFTQGFYDLEVVYPDGITVYRIAEGLVTAVPEVTR
jgi:hypothetical protein